MQSDEVLGNWIPLVDYSFKTGTSLSTLRRHIKSNKILYRLEEGRYLIYDPEAAASRLAPTNTLSGASFAQSEEHEIQKLEAELQRAHEEITELKMLLAIYEEKIGHNA